MIMYYLVNFYHVSSSSSIFQIQQIWCGGAYLDCSPQVNKNLHTLIMCFIVVKRNLNVHDESRQEPLCSYDT